MTAEEFDRIVDQYADEMIAAMTELAATYEAKMEKLLEDAGDSVPKHLAMASLARAQAKITSAAVNSE
ncbi:hypothetical protein [Hoeflea poritis]|uniref:Phage protein n=1 Tax=Hoeflea poritis TaxID=2993659 RepID=A0ABT4VMR6_9HYPH|nr:hypothetical protein [Hoeflea poritis]MDA4845969.1 hypothetical protein [Hoeflea poritis]